MTTEQLLGEQQITPTMDLVLVERKYLDLVRDRIQSVAENFDEKLVREEEEWIKALSKSFFQITVKWAQVSLAQFRSVKQMPEAEKLKNEAKEMLGSVQKNLTSYAVCYMNINRFSTLLREEIEREEVRLVRSAKEVKWTHDIVIMVDRNKKQRARLAETMDRLDKVRPKLSQVSEKYDAVFEAIATIHSKDKAPMFQRSFRSSLRMKDFKKARKVLKTILEEKKKFTLDRKSIDAAQAVVKTQGTELVDFYEENGDFLEAEEGKMLLTLAEVDFTYNSCVREMQKVKTIFGKYYLPHMQSKLDAMFRLREKLLVIGTLDSLMVLYLKLIKGIALPITTIAEARDFENGVLDHVKFLINGHFKDVGSIKEQAEGLVKEFRNNQSDFVELEELELEEVEVAEDPQEIGAN